MDDAAAATAVPFILVVIITIIGTVLPFAAAVVVVAVVLRFIVRVITVRQSSSGTHSLTRHHAAEFPLHQPSLHPDTTAH